MLSACRLGLCALAIATTGCEEGRGRRVEAIHERPERDVRVEHEREARVDYEREGKVDLERHGDEHDRDRERDGDRH